MLLLVEKVKEPDAGGAGSVLAQCVQHVPGWEEKNFQVGVTQRCCSTQSQTTMYASSHGPGDVRLVEGCPELHPTQ